MNWLNLNIQTLDSENFIGSDPVDRSTWLCLLRFCIGQENSGVIANCGAWADRKWQQLVRITKKEAMRQCDLWEWDGDSLIVWGYPDEKQDEIQMKRERAKTNGVKGGRPKNTNVETNGKPTLVNSAKAEGEGERKEKGKEGEGEGNCEVSPSPSLGYEIPKDIPFNPNRIATFEQVLKFGTGQMPPVSVECCEAFFDRMEAEGWITPRGFPLADWRPRFRSWATNWANNSNQPNRAAR
jgi:hypothetical protein